MKPIKNILRSLLLLCTVCAVYCVLAFAGTAFKITDTPFVTFWLPSGFLLGMLLISRNSNWPYLIIGALAGNLLFDFIDGKAFHISVFLAGANIITAIIGAFLYRRISQDEIRISDQVKLTIIRIAGIGLASTFCGALIGSSAIYYFYRDASWVTVFLMWWSGDFLGIILITPLVFTFNEMIKSGHVFNGKELIKSILIYSVLSLTCLAVFFFLEEQWVTYKFLIFFIIIISVYWSGFRQTMLANVMLTFFIGGALKIYSAEIIQMLNSTPENLIMNVQLFLDMAIIISLLVSGVMHEMNATKKKLGELYTFERKIADISARFINSPVDAADSIIRKALFELLPLMKCDVIALSEIDVNNKRLLSRYCFNRDGELSLGNLVPGSFPVLVDIMIQGKLFEFYSTDDMPIVAENEKKFLSASGLKSGVCVPLSLRGDVVWVIGILNYESSRRWDIDLIAQLKTAGEIFISMLDKMTIKVEKDSFQDRSNAILKAIPELMLIMNGRGVVLDYHISANGELYMRPDEFLNVSLDAYLPEDVSREYLSKIRSVLRSNAIESFEFPMSVKSKVRYFESRIVRLNQVEVLAMVHDITRRKESIRQISESEERFRQLTDSINEAFWLRDTETNAIIYVSPGYEKIWGRSSKMLFEDSMSFLETVHPDDLNLIKSSQKNMENDNYNFAEQFRIIRPDGEVRWVATKSFPVYDKEGKMYRFAGVAEDITENVAAQEFMKKSLHEKEILLKEIHHRVKNNLQIVSSLINLGLSKYSPERFADFINQTRLRINSMALLHEKLYQTPDISFINMQDYIEKLVGELKMVFNNPDNEVHIIYDLDNIFLTIDTALPCSLIINEAVTNALKYAFSGIKNPELTVAFKRENNILALHIADNGIGIEGALDMNNIKTLGLELINILVSQIKGTLDIVSDDGMKIAIRFPEPQL